jgi:hypothetical protein
MGVMIQVERQGSGPESDSLLALCKSKIDMQVALLTRDPFAQYLLEMEKEIAADDGKDAATDLLAGLREMYQSDDYWTDFKERTKAAPSDAGENLSSR